MPEVAQQHIPAQLERTVLRLVLKQRGKVLAKHIGGGCFKTCLDGKDEVSYLKIEGSFQKHYVALFDSEKFLRKAN